MKRIVTMQDISCVGKCSLTVALPVLSAMGVETAVIPTAVLSAHSVFPDFTFRDLTEELLPIARHWNSQGLRIPAIWGPGNKSTWFAPFWIRSRPRRR